MSKIQEGLMKKLLEKGSLYEGQVNKNGDRHGKGRISYFDGSSYEGDLVLNQRDGQGVETLKSGMVYDGDWVNDVKHGEGTLKYPDGKIIKTFWDNGRKHGDGVVIDPKGNESKVTFYKDLEVSLVC